MHREKMDAAKARRQAVRRSRAAQVLNGGAAATGNGSSCDFATKDVSDTRDIRAAACLSPVPCASGIVDVAAP